MSILGYCIVLVLRVFVWIAHFCCYLPPRILLYVFGFYVWDVLRAFGEVCF